MEQVQVAFRDVLNLRAKRRRCLVVGDFWSEPAQGQISFRSVGPEFNGEWGGWQAREQQTQWAREWWLGDERSRAALSRRKVESRAGKMERIESIRVVHGAAAGQFAFAGLSVWSVKVALGDAFGIPYFAEAFVDGERVSADYVLRGSSIIVFVRSSGSKGGGDSDEGRTTAAALVSTYRELAVIGERVKSLGLDPAQSVDEMVQQVAAFVEKQFGPYSKEEMLTIREVARLLGCSYGEARNRMLDGRIRSVKDGRWHRTRREWVEEYIEQRTIHADPSLTQIPLNTNRRRKAVGVKPNSIALQFLREREG